MAPFSIDELVDSTNSVLRARPRLAVSRRTVRFYVSEGLLPRPSGSPKFSRYSFEHLLRLVAARCLQDQGRSLEECRREVENLVASNTAEAANAIQALVDADRSAPQIAESMPVRVHSRAQIAVAEHRLEFGTETRHVQRIRLSATLVLEGPSHQSVPDLLDEAREKIGSMLLRDTT